MKETIALNWPVNMKLYDKRIKKFILKAVESGTLTQTKGKGLRGRFTVAGWKPPKKKKRKPLTSKKDDVDEVRAGLECGVVLEDTNDIKPGDQLEVFEVEERERTLEVS